MISVMKINVKTNYEMLKSIRKPTLPSSRKHKSIKDYNRSTFKKNWD